ncbi:hypothetical protein SAY87_010061 [Trapa incisa]|uniref:Uncharacterized protein n=1 Tax=Trapa incisa TaxID=236973 RepID=A0AAN7GKY2_9MYRT|nr:hypothetical protein SAY87_010061 [Trapa incisa]
MAKNIGLLACLLIIAMDVVAGILGIQAEIAENKVKHLKVWVIECRDPSYQAFKLGLAAAILLALAHAIGSLLGGCICIWSKEDLDSANANKQLAVASLIFSWIIMAVGFLMLILGALLNSKTRRSCGIAHPRLLLIGGVLCFIHGLFTVGYYVTTKAIIREARMAHQSGGQA